MNDFKPRPGAWAHIIFVEGNGDREAVHEP